MRIGGRPLLVVPFCFLFCAGLALAQRGAGGGVPRDLGGSIPGSPPPLSPNYPNVSTEQRPLFLSGRVVLDDGTPPPESVLIERVCRMRPVPEAYTDSKGRFSFEVGHDEGIFADASVKDSYRPGWDPRRDAQGGALNGPLVPGTVNLQGCELRASLAGYRSDVILLDRRSFSDSPEVGTIVLHRLGKGEGAAISATTLAAPKDARKLYEKAQKLLVGENPKNAEAAKDLEKAVASYPKYAAAWFLLGRARLALKDEEGGRKAFEQSVAADPKYLSPYADLIQLDLGAGDWSAAADRSDKLIQLAPQLTLAYYLNGVANLNAGKIEPAENSIRKALGNDDASQWPQLHQLLGAVLAQQGKFPAAAEEYRAYITAAPKSLDAEKVRKQIVEWEGLGVIPREQTAKKDSGTEVK